MKRLYIIIAVVCIFASCETEVKFKGTQTAPQMLLESTLCDNEQLSVFVGRSFFFLDKSYYGGNNYYSTNTYLNNCTLDDATVEYQLNGREWKPMQIEYDSVNKIYLYMANDVILRQGDSVNIKATHPDYETVTASQVIPKNVNFIIADQQYDNDNYSIDLELKQYNGNPTDYVAISIKGRLYCLSETYKQLNEFLSRVFYSKEPIFGECANLRSSKLNYYPMKNGYLFVPASALLEQDLRLKFMLLFSDKRFIPDKTYYYALVSNVQVETWTRDEYLNYCTKMAYLGYMDDEYADVYETNYDDYFDFEDLINEMAELLTDFETESRTQIYSNVSSGYGCLGAKSVVNQQKITYVPVK